MELESLPEGWEIRSLGEVAEIKAGNPAPQKEKYFENGNIPFVRVQDLGRYGKTSFLTEVKDKVNSVAITECKLKIFPEGTVLLPKSGMSTLLNHRAILAKNACVVSHLAAIIPQKNALSEYLYYFLCTLDSSRIAQRTTLPSIKLKTLSNLEIPIPPLEEQKKIVEILQFADYLKERRKEAFKLIDKIVMSLFYDMFGDPATNPKGWEIERLDKICNFDTYQILPDARREYFYLGLEDIESNTGKIIKNTKTLGSKILSNKHNFDKSHVLYGKLRPYLNKVAMPMQEGICSTDIIPLKPDENYLMREFLVYYLRDKNFIKWAAEHSTGTKMPRIQTSTLKKHQIPLPPLDLQQEFAEIVSKLEDKRKKMEEAEEKLEMLYQILLRQAFTGKLTEEWRWHQKF